MLKLVQPSVLFRQLYPSLIWRIPTQDKKLYLSFDDGPIPEVTPWVLEQLKTYQAKATFFCLGKNLQRHPDIAQCILREGHRIGNHSFSHLNGWKQNDKDYLNDILQAQEIQDSRLFRPPYGKIRSSQIKQLRKQFKIVMWDVLSYDFDAQTSKEQCAKQVIVKARNGSIIVFHDSLKAKSNLTYALPIVLKELHARGYQFETIPL